MESPHGQGLDDTLPWQYRRNILCCWRYREKKRFLLLLFVNQAGPGLDIPEGDESVLQ